MKPQFTVHIFMNGQVAKRDTLPFQINFHDPISIDTPMLMIDFLNLIQHSLVLCIIIRLPIFQEVIVSIGYDMKPAEQPTHAECSVMVLDKSISL